jgi:hypothetical protein
MNLELSEVDVMALRNALAVRSIQLEQLLSVHDENEAVYVGQGRPWDDLDRVRNARLRASLSYEVARVKDLDAVLLAELAKR